MFFSWVAGGGIICYDGVMITPINQPFNVVEFFTDLTKLRYRIAKVMYYHDLIDEIKPWDGTLNTLYGRVGKNSKAVFALEFVNDILPYCFYTPYGALELNPGVNLNLIYEMMTPQERASFFRDLRREIKMVAIKPYIKGEYSERVKQSAVYGVVEVPGKKATLNEMYQESALPMGNKTAIIEQEKAYMHEVYQKVNAGLEQEKLPALKYDDPYERPKSYLYEPGRC